MSLTSTPSTLHITSESIYVVVVCSNLSVTSQLLLTRSIVDFHDGTFIKRASRDGYRGPRALDQVPCFGFFRPPPWAAAPSPDTLRKGRLTHRCHSIFSLMPTLLARHLKFPSPRAKPLKPLPVTPEIIIPTIDEIVHDQVLSAKILR